ncbi:MAG TPA: aldo/keto reductase [Gaiellaceae bacterium]|nr:aldo/keto reductase [Gaiellaceae bacterium]
MAPDDARPPGACGHRYSARRRASRRPGHRGVVVGLWLDDSELRIGLGCMRMSTDETRDDDLSMKTIAAAAQAGVTVFDTARAYGDNERLVARGLRSCGAEGTARIVTKGGMTRPGGAWVPDGRAKAILADCAASVEALDGLPIDLYLIHAPDPRTPWRTSVRALARLAEEGIVRHVGLANVNRHQLDEALELAPVAAVQVALSRFEDRALRGGLVERCDELGITLLAHSPLGGPKRARRTDAQEALAWLLNLSRVVVPIPGARRPETARSAARVAANALDPAPFRRGGSRLPLRADAEVVLVMGIPGAGKSSIAADYAARGYLRLNRDERGGSLRELTGALDEALAAGSRLVVLDNTYLTRAARNDVIQTARGHGVSTRCVWLDTPLAQAQINLVERLLDRFGSLPSPAQLRELARREPGVLAPTSQMRAVRELERPSADEGFARIETVPFVRAPSSGTPGVFVAARALDEPGWEASIGDRDTQHLVYDWNPDGDVSALDAAAARLAKAVSRPVEAALCPHAAGPPTCWCRPPLPGLPLAFARAHGIDPARSTLIGSAPAHHTLATTLGARYVPVT